MNGFEGVLAEQRNDTRPENPVDSHPADFVSPATVIVLEILFVSAVFSLFYLLTAFWPFALSDKNWANTVVLFGFRPFKVGQEVRLMWIVLFSAALGSCIHAVTSFTTYLGNGSFKKSWLPWYIMRIPVGSALAMVFYFVLRGGLFSASTAPSEVSPFGVAALSGMAGMFSKQAIDKLRETFDNLFKTGPGKGDDVRKNGLNPVFDTVNTEAARAAAAGGLGK